MDNNNNNNNNLKLNNNNNDLKINDNNLNSQNITQSVSNAFNNTINTVSNTVQSTFGEKNSLTENFVLIMGLFIVFITFMILFFMSKTFNVKSTIDTIKMYQNYQDITPIDYTKIGSKKLKNFYVCSAYNCCLNGTQLLTYVDERILLSCLKSGARYVEFNIFNDKYGEEAKPVVSNGYSVGEWKLTLDVIDFENCCKIMRDNAFTISSGDDSGVSNPTDPLFIGLNLNTNNNIFCLNRIYNLLVQYFRPRLLTNKYQFQQSNLADATLNELREKVVIISSDGYQGSNLEEIVNYSWSLNNMQRIHKSELESQDYSKKTMINYNKDNLTIVVPNEEGDFYSENYDPLEAFNSGCQFVSMNFQYIDYGIDRYITKFKTSSFVEKSQNITGN